MSKNELRRVWLCSYDVSISDSLESSKMKTVQYSLTLPIKLKFQEVVDIYEKELQSLYHKPINIFKLEDMGLTRILNI